MRSYMAAAMIALAACAHPSSDGDEAVADFAKEGASPRPSSQSRVVGLISLPQLFGDQSCDSYAPSEVGLYSEPDSAHPSGVIRVAQPWTLHEDGGCEGLRVVVDVESADSAAALPTLEYGYETPGAVVLEQHGDWFKIRLADGEAWMRGSGENRFMPMEDLLASNLTYIAEPDGRGLSSVPGSTDRPIAAGLLSAGRSVRVLESRTINGELWLRVAVYGQSPCESPEDPVTVAEGWLPARTQTGEPMVWFHARGC